MPTATIPVFRDFDLFLRGFFPSGFFPSPTDSPRDYTIAEEDGVIAVTLASTFPFTTAEFTDATITLTGDALSVGADDAISGTITGLVFSSIELPDIATFETVAIDAAIFSGLLADATEGDSSAIDDVAELLGTAVENITFGDSDDIVSGESIVLYAANVDLGAGDDGWALSLDDTLTEAIDGGPGFDFLDLYSLRGFDEEIIEIDLVTGTLTSEYGSISVTGFEAFYTFFATLLVTGTESGEEIRTGSGFDTVFAGGGNDTIYAKTANQVLDGGEGDDVAIFSIELSDAEFTVLPNRQLEVSSTLLTSVERLQFRDVTINTADILDFEPPIATEFDDLLEGSVLAEDIQGGAGNDTINGRGDDDTLDGGIGFDEIDGGSGNDLIRGRDGFDTLVGGDGNDTIYGNNGFDSVTGGLGNDLIEGGLGTDTLLGGEGRDTLLGLAADDVLFGGTGQDTLFGNAANDILNGGADRDRLEGGIGFDALFGDAGNDILRGDDGFDTLDGGDGNDIVIGNAGNDLIDGGSGDDSLGGGIGADTFRFADNTGADVIVDFQTGIDDLSFAAADFDTPDPEALRALASVSGDALVIDFGDGNSLTINGVTQFDAIAGSISFFE